ncbi:MFS transporter [Cohnella lubricantis]|uniref:MFS transporter n=1 Tax=Cohnella lubricantis TaxID=2163172 RepID=A0A841TI33_9BACL|nr:MFS transporter [Cohnella lubricantis]MBB6678898.1 MFS transporter [Cohnella lubricantis]MBP2120223.1 putative MFS family arabinose efflux permease [Cohnella lubricantis]
MSSSTSQSSADKSSLLKQPKAVWAVGFACIIAFMGLGLVDPILPAIAAKMDASASQVSLLFTSYNAVMAVMMLITGVITSRIGVKNTLLAGIVFIAVFSCLGALSNDVWALIGYRAGWGLGNSLFVATALTAIVTFSSSGVAKAVILYEAAVGLGISVGPLLGGELGSISWRGPFFGVAALMVIAFVSLSLMMPKQQRTLAPTASSAPKKKASLKDPFVALAKHRSLFVLGLLACFYNFGFFTILAYAPLVLGEMGLDAHQLGYVFLAWGILLAITSVFMAPVLQRRFGTLKSMTAMLLLFAVTLVIAGIWTDSKWVLIAIVVIVGALLGNNNTLITTAVMNAAPVERSTASAAYSFLRFIGGAIAPYLAGKLAEWYNPHVPFLVGAGFVLVGILYFLFNKKHVQHVDHAPGH